FAVPAAVFVIVVFGLIRGVPVFDAFLSGAKEGLGSAVSILPPLVGLVMAVSMLNASGALDILSSLL
ncbi:MAG TPA: spore maturation protein, partial [Ruminococcaceae bacterium]|nr:spore maturation protein [Oscillospiraceae bacterium]